MTTTYSDHSPLEQRNAEICALRNGGASYPHIAHTCSLSVEAVRGICLKDQFIKQREQRKQNQSELKEDTDLYVLMVEQNRIYREQGGCAGLPLQSYHQVLQFWPKQGHSGFPPIEFLFDLPLEEFAKKRGVGRNILSFIVSVRESLGKPYSKGDDNHGQCL